MNQQGGIAKKIIAEMKYANTNFICYDFLFGFFRV